MKNISNLISLVIVAFSTWKVISGDYFFALFIILIIGAHGYMWYMKKSYPRRMIEGEKVAKEKIESKLREDEGQAVDLEQYEIQFNHHIEMQLNVVDGKHEVSFTVLKNEKTYAYGIYRKYLHKKKEEFIYQMEGNK